MNGKKRKLTLFGKVFVIKTYALSKLVFPASVLSVPEQVVSKLKTIFFEYLWGKRDKVKRSTVIKKLQEGGLNMVDLDSYFMSLKASWVPRIRVLNGKWTDCFNYYVHKLHLDSNYIFKMTTVSVNDFPILKVLPKFYCDMIIAFNKSKTKKPFHLLTKHEIMQQPLWGNDYFRICNTPLYFKQWIKAGMLYVKDLISNDGLVKGDHTLYRDIDVKQDIVKQLYIIKKVIIKKLKRIDTSIGPYVNIKN